MHPKKALVGIPLVLGATLACSTTQTAHDVNAPKNFIYLGVERSRISEAEFLGSKSIVGAQLKYRWQELERDRDRLFGSALGRFWIGASELP